MSAESKSTSRPKATGVIALAFLARVPGAYVFPVAAGKKDPPLIGDNLNAASNDPKQIEAWAKQWPGCNWAVALRKSRLLCVDVDRKPGKIGAATFDKLSAEYRDIEGPAFPATYQVQSPSGGWHLYYRGEHRFALGKNGFGADIDSPNYVILPGCTLASGGAYKVTDDLPLADAPAWFYNVLKPKADSTATEQIPGVELDTPAAFAWAIEYLTTTAPSSVNGRNGEKTVFDIACVLKDRGISLDNAVVLMGEHYNVAPRPDPLDPESIDPNSPPYCDPLWNIGVGPDADRLDVKVRNAYAYARENAPGAGTAEAHFRDDLISVEEMKGFAESWSKRDAAQRKAKAAKAKAEAVSAFKTDPPPPETDAEIKQRLRRTAERRKRKEQSAEPETLRSLLDGWCYIGQQKRFVRKRDGMMWEGPAFDAYFADISVADKRDTTPLSRHMLSRPRGHDQAMQKFDTFCYLPGEPESVGGAYNQYVESDIIAAPSSTRLWDSHLEYLFPDKAARDRVLDWMAWVLQNLGKKPKHALFIRGETQGTGKSWIGDVLTALIGVDNVTPIDQGDFETPHNGWQMRTKLCICEEVRALSLPASRKLFGWLTQVRLHINEKNLPQVTIPDVIAYLFFSNKLDALPIDDTDRRYLIESTTAKPKGRDYYARLFDVLDDPVALAAIKRQLLVRELGSYTAAGSAPFTAAKADMIEESASDLQSYMTTRADSPPFCHSLVTVNEVADAIPKEYRPRSRVLATVRDVMRRRFNAVSIPFMVQTGERKSDQGRVWAIGRDAAKVAKVAAMQWADVSALYRSEHKADRGRADASAADDFRGD